MLLSQWRPSLRAWLLAQVTIDTWVLDVPETVGITACLLPPVRLLSYTLQNQAEVEGELQQDIWIVKRYSRDLTYDQLPLNIIEGYYQTVAVRLAHDFKDIIDDLLDLAVLPIDGPITVRQAETEDRDWIVELHWYIRATYLAEPEVGETQPPYDLREIRVGIYRSALGDFETNRLDTNLNLDVTPLVLP